MASHRGYDSGQQLGGSRRDQVIEIQRIQDSEMPIQPLQDAAPCSQSESVQENVEIQSHVCVNPEAR